MLIGVIENDNLTLPPAVNPLVVRARAGVRHGLSATRTRSIGSMGRWFCRKSADFHSAQCKIEVLHPSDDSHKKAGDERRTLHRPDAKWPISAVNWIREYPATPQCHANSFSRIHRRKNGAGKLRFHRPSIKVVGETLSAALSWCAAGEF